MEGVMMRGQRYMAVAVRAPSDEIIIRSEELPPRLYQSPIARIPFLRGSIMLWDTLGLGMRALMFSADVAMGEEDVKLSKSVTWTTAAIGIVLGIGIFFVLPVVLTTFVHRQIGNSLLANVLEGVVRLLMLVGYVGVIGLMPDIRRVYQYHGAEHKAINAFEGGARLRSAEIAPFSVRHPRCGTNFLLIVGALSIAVFAPLGRPDSWLILVGSRIVLVPVIAGLAYEAIKWGSSHITNPVVAILMKPGLAMQSLTTREPTLPQIEVSAAALREVIRLERPEMLDAEELEAIPEPIV
ncbi:MAG: hypothetical protein QOF51_1154 [Chloroflexota bacterium]|jgi:uncharacterized protein YqhQ|nr:hypothetical protein [Chloroflexota bacterium]